MKKLLALILSVIMLLSVMPVAFAAEKSLTDIYVDEVIKLWTYGGNTYDNQSFKEYVLDTYLNSTGENDTTEQWEAETEEEVPAKLERLKEINAEIEARLTNGEVAVIVDTYDYIKALLEYYYFAHYNDDAVEELLGNKLFLENIHYDEINEDYFRANDILRYGGATQAEFDALATGVIVGYELLIKHASGDHDFNEYVSNNDATEEADGTKTATCNLCGATDTVTDEGSKLVKEPATFLEKFIALIKEFFAKILSIFG